MNPCRSPDGQTFFLWSVVLARIYVHFPWHMEKAADAKVGHAHATRSGNHFMGPTIMIGIPGPVASNAPA